MPDVSIVEASAELLYGLVHQRYILTRAGLQAMVRASVFIYVATALTSKSGREVRPGRVRRLSARLLQRLQRRTLWPLRPARSGHREALLSELQRHLCPTEQPLPGR